MPSHTKLKSAQAIGIFDSGIGGLTVAKAIHAAMPNERIIYFGDTAHMPYGDKSAQNILAYCIKIADFLVRKKIKILVIACNSASSVAYYYLKEKYADKLDVISVITPVARYAAEKDYKKIGVIGTKATIDSGAHQRKINAINSKVKVASLSTPLLASMIEEGFYKNNISESIIESYLNNKKLANIDAIILACTHYPLIKKEIVNYYNASVEVIDTTEIVAASVKDSLQKANLLFEFNKEKDDQFFVSEYTESFEKSTKMFYSKKINIQEVDLWVDGF